MLLVVGEAWFKAAPDARTRAIIERLGDRTRLEKAGKS